MEPQEEEKIYYDESIIAMRNQAKRNKKQDIYETCFVQGEAITFALRLLYEDKIMMMVPETFAEMDEEVVMTKYPSVDSPELILTGPENNCDLTFSLIDEAVEEEELPAMMAILKNTIQTTQPANEIYALGEIRSEKGGLIAYLSFKSYAIGGALFNLMVTAIIDQKVLLCSFNCAEEAREEWEDLAYQMMETIEDRGKERSRLQ